MKKEMLTVVIFSMIVLVGCTQGNTGTQVNNTESQAATTQITQPIETTQHAQTAQPAQTTASNADIGEAKAKEIALAHAGLAEADVVFVRVNLDYDNGRNEYEVEFYSGNIEYDYDIDAASGEIVSYDQDAEYYAPTQAMNNSASSTDIGEAKAKEIALAHAGLAEADVVFVRVNLDYDDGRSEYEVEFYSGNIEYDYDIDAITGAIISVDQDAEYYTPN